MGIDYYGQLTRTQPFSQIFILIGVILHTFSIHYPKPFLVIDDGGVVDLRSLRRVKWSLIKRVEAEFGLPYLTRTKLMVHTHDSPRILKFKPPDLRDVAELINSKLEEDSQ